MGCRTAFEEPFSNDNGYLVVPVAAATAWITTLGSIGLTVRSDFSLGASRFVLRLLWDRGPHLGEWRDEQT